MIVFIESNYTNKLNIGIVRFDISIIKVCSGKYKIFWGNIQKSMNFCWKFIIRYIFSPFDFFYFFIFLFS